MKEADVDFSPLRLLLQAAARNPQRLHLVGLAPAGTSIFPALPQQPATEFTLTHSSTLAESADLALRLVSFLQDRVAPGDRVAVWSANSVWHLLVHVACAGVQAVCVPLDQHYSAGEFANIWRDASPSLVFAGPQQLARLAAAEFFPEDGILNSFVDITALPSTLAATTPAATWLPCDADQLGALIYTSGTSSHPKGVALTHANLWWGCRNFREVFTYASDFVEAVVAPLSHIGGFNGTTLDLVYSGGTVVVIESFQATTVLAALEFFKVQMMFGVPTIYRRLLADPTRLSRDLSAFIRPLIGGSALPTDLAVALHQVGWAPYNVWGMTEQSASGTCLSPGMAPEAQNGIGIPFPYTKVRVVKHISGNTLETTSTSELIDCAPGEVGMLICSGPSVTHGYWNDPELNSKSFVGPWLITGDLGYLDSCGNFQFAARATDTINTGGEKVLPEPVAEALRSLPQVKDAQVLGVPDEQWGQIVAAVIISTDPGLNSLSNAQVLEFVRKEMASVLARYKLPKAVRIVDTFPISSNGKVSKAGLLALFN